MTPYPFPAVEELQRLALAEVDQRREEGCDVGDLKQRIERATGDRDALLALWDETTSLTPSAEFAYVEPSDWDAIQQQRPSDRIELTPPKTIDAAIADRIHGAWLGRCAGMVLGKPFETRPFVSDWRAGKTYLETAGAWPLSDYIPNDPRACAAVGIKTLPCTPSQRGSVHYVEPDDDVRYTIMGLDILEQCGPEFQTGDVGRWWTHCLPAAVVYTAEQAAYRNLVLLNAYSPQTLGEEQLAWVREWFNPYREWIGAQIRADGWALACPGDPRRAAEFAYRDARLSHVKNGVYGEMFCAAMLAAALVVDDTLEVVQIGLGAIPEQSRLAEAIRLTIDLCQSVGCDSRRFETVVEWLWKTFGQYDPGHTINNAAAVAAAIMLGRRDFTATVGMAVMCGWDTDCNGATAGAICGAMAGAERLPTAWTAPLSDTIRSGVVGFHPIAISDCARRHTELARRLSE